MQSTSPRRKPSRAALLSLLLVGSVPAACARAPRIEAFQPTRTAVAELDDGGALLLEAGMPTTALPTGDTLTLDEVKRMRLMLSLPASVEHYAPRLVADTVLREVELTQKPVRRENLNQHLQRFQTLVVLRPDGFLAAALTGRAQQCVGPVEPRDGALRAGPYEVGVWYRRGQDGAAQRVVEIPEPRK